MGRRGWAILIGVVVIAVVAGLAVWALGARSGQPAASPTPAATPTVSPTPSSSPTPSASLTPLEPVVAVTCETISTAGFQAMMAANGWVSWETQDEQIGAAPFERFPDGTPDDAVVCRWGESPGLATDNVIDLAWSPLAPASAAAAQEALVAAGFERVDAPEGVYLAIKPAGGDRVDAEGYGETYLFTEDDVRWGYTKEYVGYVKAPDEEG